MNFEEYLNLEHDHDQKLKMYNLFMVKDGQKGKLNDEPLTADDLKSLMMHYQDVEGGYESLETEVIHHKEIGI